jgi:UDP-N-acetylglucosamine diphosphorylase/glucosamine-1-phosphate N-acetyltransferase
MNQAVILAAGEGQKLRPFTVTRPKGMLFIADKPVLQYIVESLVQAGIRDIIMVVGYRKEQVYDYMGSGEKFGVKITYAVQSQQLGTAHALAQVGELVNDRFLVFPGDNLIDASTIIDFIDEEPEAVLVKRSDNPSKYGVINAKGSKIKTIIEKPKEAGSNLVNTGIYAFNKDVFGYIEGVLDIPDVLNNMIAAGRTIKAVETGGMWLDVMYPWDIISLNNAVLQNITAKLGGTVEEGVVIKGKVIIGEGTVIRANSCIYGPAVIGSGCEIGPNACIMPSTSIGDNVSVASFTQLKNSVIGDDVTLGPGCYISDSVIDNGCTIKGRFTALGGQSELRISGDCPAINVGVIMGENCSVESSVTAQPGVVVGNHCQIQFMKMLVSHLPDNSLVY